MQGLINENLGRYVELKCLPENRKVWKSKLYVVNLQPNGCVLNEKKNNQDTYIATFVQNVHVADEIRSRCGGPKTYTDQPFKTFLIVIFNGPSITTFSQLNTYRHVKFMYR